MKKSIFSIALVITLLLSVQCTKKENPFLITNTSVGLIHKDMPIKAIDSILKNDSIVPLSSIKNSLGTQGEVEVYSKDGKKLLLLSPHAENNPASLLTNIQVFDSRYITEKGLHSGSTFKDLKSNYEIEAIETTPRSVTVMLKDSPIYVIIDKQKLPENLRYDPSLTIEASQIPDEAPFKYFMIDWEVEDDSDAKE